MISQAGLRKCLGLWFLLLQILQYLQCSIATTDALQLEHKVKQRNINVFNIPDNDADFIKEGIHQSGEWAWIDKRERAFIIAL